jgi:ATP-dependent RNA helicase SUPV3L1/SUV3
MATKIESIPQAGLIPTANHLEIFSNAMDILDRDGKKMSLHSLLEKFNEMASVKGDFFLCRRTPMLVIAQKLAPLDLTIKEKYTLCMCPVNMQSKHSMEVLIRFATKLAAGEVSGVSSRTPLVRPKSFEDLARLCGLYNELELFLWLQNKFSGSIMEEQTALARKELAIKLIGEALSSADKLKLDHCYISRDKQLRDSWKARQNGSGFDEDESDANWNEGTLDL